MTPGGNGRAPVGGVPLHQKLFGGPGGFSDFTRSISQFPSEFGAWRTDMGAANKTLGAALSAGNAEQIKAANAALELTDAGHSPFRNLGAGARDFFLASGMKGQGALRGAAIGARAGGAVLGAGLAMKGLGAAMNFVFD